MKLLKEKNLESYAPSISMVINKDTAHDVRDFVKYALNKNLRRCTFFFDNTENNCLSTDLFADGDTLRPVLFELMKMERVLAGKFYLNFRIYIAYKEQELLQPHVESIQINELCNEYTDILELAEGRSMLFEYEERNKVRCKFGKKFLSLDDDYTFFCKQVNINDTLVCAVPFKGLDIYPNKDFECCSWIHPRFNINKVIKDKKINWEEEYNTIEMRLLRKDIINDCYDLCMASCPLNPKHKKAWSLHKHGFHRIIQSNKALKNQQGMTE